MPMTDGVTEITKGSQVVEVIASTLRTQLDVVNLKLTVGRVWRIATDLAAIVVALSGFTALRCPGWHSRFFYVSYVA